jgi:hypothetical protein
MIFVAKNNYFLQPAFAYCLFISKRTSGELITILSPVPDGAGTYYYYS